MKASAKIALVGLVILAIGVGVGTAGGFIAMSNDEGANNIVIRNKEEAISTSNAINSLTLGSIEDDVEINWSETATELGIKYFDAEEESKRVYVVKETSTSLELKVNDDFWKRFMNITWPWNKKEDSDHKIEVTIPKSMENLVLVTSTVSGDIVMNKDAKDVGVGSAVINTVSGDINIKSIESKNRVVINTTSSAITLDNIKSLDSSMEINSVSGKVSLTNSFAKGTVKVSGTSGETLIDTLKCDSLEVNGVSGLIDVKKLDVKRKVNIASVSGAVNLGLVDSMDNYSIEINTLSGSKNVSDIKDASRPKEIDINTTSGSVSVTFAA